MSKRDVGKILLAVNYLFPILLVIIMRRWGGELTDVKLLILALEIFVVWPTAYILMNIYIARFIKISSLVSALILFSGLMQFEIGDFMVRIVFSEIVRYDLKTINLFIIRIGYYFFVSLIYYLIKKDNNIKPIGVSK